MIAPEGICHLPLDDRFPQMPLADLQFPQTVLLLSNDVALVEVTGARARLRLTGFGATGCQGVYLALRGPSCRFPPAVASRKSLTVPISAQSLSSPARSGSPAAHWQRDLLASLVVFLVALPLCIGISVAVGVSPARGLITGIIGGIVVGYLAGSPLQVSGPAAGLFVIVADLLRRHREHYLGAASTDLEATAREAAAEEHALAMLGMAVVLAGGLQVIAGRLRLGQWFRAVSPAVIKGMLSGIGILILVSQFHMMLDHAATWHGEPAHGALQYAATIPEAIWKCFDAQSSHSHHLAAATGLITIGTILLWQWISRRVRSCKLLPAPLLAIALATTFATGIEWWEHRPVHRLEVPGNMFAEVTFPTLASFKAILTPEMLTAALVIALVASAETLLCATAVDQMQNRARTNYDQELTAQGVGNLLCGLVGALPMTGVIVRSSANVEAGAESRWSAILHGVWLLLFVALLPAVLGYIPKSALGALLVYTGYKLVNIGEIKKLWQVSRSEVAIYAITLTFIVTTDLLTGVLIGIGISAFKLLHRFTNLQAELQQGTGAKVTLILRGAATFVRLPVLARQLERVPRGAELHVDFHELQYIDHACLDLLMNWAEQHESNEGRLVVDWDLLHGRFKHTPETSHSLIAKLTSRQNDFAAVSVPNRSTFRPRRIEELALLDQGILIVGIERHVEGEWQYRASPDGSTEILPGDRLYLYGPRDRFPQGVEDLLTPSGKGVPTLV